MDTSRHYVTVIAATLLLAACANPSPSHDIGNAQRKGFVGGILLADGAAVVEAPKVIVTSYALNGAALTPQQALVSYGSGDSLTSSGDDYRIELLDANHSILRTYSVADPRKFVVERQGVVENPTGVLTTRFRFEAEAALVRVRDRNANIVAETAVRSLIVEFCRRAHSDPECRKTPQGSEAPGVTRAWPLSQRRQGE